MYCIVEFKLKYLDDVRAMGIKVTMVTQILEAELGYGSVVAVGGLDKKEAIAWDSGGGSFQITRRRKAEKVEGGGGGDALDTGALEAYMGALGSGISNTALIKEVLCKDLVTTTTANPVSAEEAEKLIQVLIGKISEVPSWLVRADYVTASAGSNSIFKVCCDVLSSLEEYRSNSPVTEFTYEMACRALAECVGKTDKELFKYVAFEHADLPFLIVPKLSLLCAVMRHTGIKKVGTVKCVGSCAGLLCDERFWDVKIPLPQKVSESRARSPRKRSRESSRDISTWSPAAFFALGVVVGTGFALTKYFYNVYFTSKKRN